MQFRAGEDDLRWLDYIAGISGHTRSSMLRWLVRREYHEMQRSNASLQIAQDSATTK